MRTIDLIVVGGLASFLALSLPWYLLDVLYRRREKRFWRMVGRWRFTSKKAAVNHRVRVVVTLIHGTFATNAAWTRPGSEFREGLVSILAKGDRRRIAPEDVRFRRFFWSGWNGMAARRTAAEHLRWMIKRNTQQWPGAVHIAVAHSHGGNVALEAMAPEIEYFSRFGLVCLSTPVIHVSRRPYSSFFHLAHKVGDWTLAAAFVWMVAVLDTPLLMKLWGYAMVGGILMQSLLATGKLNRDVAFEAEARVPQAHRHRVIFLRYAGDEASGFLGAATLASWGLHASIKALWRRVEGVIRVADDVRQRTNPWILLAVVLTGASVAVGAFETLQTLPWQIQGLVYAAFAILLLALFDHLTGGRAVTCLLSLVVGMPLVLLSALAAIPGMAFGHDIYMYGAFSQISAEATPTGKGWQVVTFDDRNASYDRADTDPTIRSDRDAARARAKELRKRIYGESLRHSEPYLDVKVIEEVAKFIKRRVQEYASEVITRS